jgi:small subunit ribosomal protein S16
MPTKMRLQRFGKKGKPFYHIVIADGRAPRDGRFIEKIGTYNPVAKPAIIELDFDKAYDWYVKGADPTPTVKTILSDKGILYFNHLMKGVAKGAFTKEVAEDRLNEWKEAKQSKIISAVKSEQLIDKEADKKRLEAEVKINEARAAEIAKKRQKEVDAARAEAEGPQAEAEVIEEPAVEEPVAEEVVAEEPVAEEPVAEEPVAEEPVAEVPAIEEPATEAVVEEPVTEPAIEEPAAEETATEEPATDKPAAE